MPNKQEITAHFLRETFDYNQETGRFIWKKGKCSGKYADHGMRKKEDSYLYLRISETRIPAHRAAWIITHGDSDFSSVFIDHIDRNKSNNSIKNLRLATNKQNQENCGPRKDNTSGFRGVGPMGKRWSARIKHNGKSIWIGLFDTKEKAALAYEEKAKNIFTHFVCN